MAKRQPITIEFDAYLPPVKSAMLIDGLGDEMHIKLSVALKQSPEALRMASMTGKRLHVTVTELPDLLIPPKIQNDRQTKANPLYAKTKR